MKGSALQEKLKVVEEKNGQYALLFDGVRHLYNRLRHECSEVVGALAGNEHRLLHYKRRTFSLEEERSRREAFDKASDSLSEIFRSFAKLFEG